MHGVRAENDEVGSRCFKSHSLSGQQDTREIPVSRSLKLADLGRIEVAESVTDVNGRMIFGSPKSHARRCVPIPRFLRDDLASQLADRAPDDLVFPSTAGTPLRVQSFRRWHCDRAAATGGLEGLVLHELRHTTASLAIASGASIKGVQSMLGHASAAMTLDRYGHPFGDELDAVADRMDAARENWMRTEAGSARIHRLH